ncbi:ABC transporter ATP-binding protein [Microbacterium kunmingense]|uniref:ABC transporter ATP-binding protein n=1 Tax=Microbacterium kunmingense TaxID=2915939 RepID=UPI002003E586|nr:ABC transporter ATP-binding protein [Microbacterium kunmingense]
MTTHVEQVRAAYGDREVLHDVDLDIGPGERVSVLGPSGSGKSTLLRVIAGLHPAVGGRVVIDGQDVTSLPPEARGIGLVPQEGALFPHLDVAANVGYGIRGLRLRHAHRDPRVRDLVEVVGLGDLLRRRPHELSGGQRQRVAVARALAHEPRLVLMDEPFSALDAGLRQQVRDDVTQILRDRGVGVALITHDQEEALSLGDRVAVMRDGRIVQHGTPREVYTTPVDTWTARFLGEALVLPAVARTDRATCALGDIALATPAQGTVQIILRPEQITLVAASSPASGPGSGEVTRVRYFGHDVLVDLRLTGGTGLTVRTGPDIHVSAGQRAAISVHGAAVAVASD